MPEFHSIPIDRRQRLREVRDCLGSAQVPPRRFFALYLGLVTVIDLVSVGVQLLGGDTPLLEDLPSLFAVVLSNLLVQLLLVGTLLYGLAVWRGQRGGTEPAPCRGIGADLWRLGAPGERRGEVTPPYGCNAGGAKQRADVPRAWPPPPKFRPEIWGVGHRHRPLRRRGAARRVVVPYGGGERSFLGKL